MRSEEDLVRTLRAAADQAKPLPGGLTEAVAARRRGHKKGQWARMALAAAAVVVLVGGTAFALSSGGGQAGPATQITTTSTTSPIEHVTVVWPEAIAKVPRVASNGWKYRPVATISPTEILLAADKSFEKAGRVVVYDMTTKTTRELGEVPEPRRGYFVQEWGSNDQQIVWYGETPNNKDVWADIWVMPRAGGEPRRLTELTGDQARIEVLSVTADHVVWSVRAGGVYRIPLTGGEPEKIQGTDDLHLNAWPWAYAFGPGPQGKRNQTRLVNLETGNSIDISVDKGDEGVLCNEHKCIGTRDDRMFSQGPQGDSRKLLPKGMAMHTPEERLQDDVLSVVGGGSNGQQAYDLRSDRLVSFGKEGLGYWTLPGLLAWDDDAEGVQKCENDSCTTEEKGGGKELTVVNLKAIRR
ncbi:hypothetical protein [Nonomuraea endophytica]|uniref:WD40 repeat domain-containing protein n=1 Tax=Nonomuraea endophytica TaxID=714136 RepID=A0A7W7ZXS6_9ACTN|nr:hypothetical protein [Nonomuraea endophytica]MBB5075802.1 hypothetical protein [Nonomuraea endophytica]